MAQVTGSDCPSFAEAVIVDDIGTALPPAGTALVIELARGRRITIFPAASPVLAAVALEALR
ncbi:hypothetical protein [Sandarakinorhabdus cyanobacteriorum]|uniref:hypothetical protein n=1 Tax=Sandarakinorhabdus cyanobacteriorum TaxID=1981098 RepID=UPI0010560561|nr:hypothetical protein [Sandarakinorhabdus cyanobacteriorum]